jgi:hypothetical protein
MDEDSTLVDHWIVACVSLTELTTGPRVIVGAV